MNAPVSNFGLADYAVLFAMLLISSGIGIYFRLSGGRQKTTSEYLFANGQMSALPLAFSLMSSFMSAITLLGVSAENYSYGTMFTIHNVAFGLCTPIIAYLFVPVYFKVGVNSVYQYLEKRFGNSAKISGSIAFTIQMVLYMGVALYAPALALETVTGMPKAYAILSVGFVCTFYSTIGGLKAVIFTDVFQSLLMYAAVFSVIAVAWIDKGSLAEIWRIADSHGRIQFDNFDLDPTVRHTWWGIILGGSVTYLSVYAVNQGQIQRYISTGNLETAQYAVWINWPIVSLLSLSTSFAGLAIFSKYAECDPFKTCKIDRSDQLMPYYVVDTMGHIPGLPGLFVSGIFSAALSTVSAAMNSLAAVTLEDYVKPLYKRISRKDYPDQSSFSAKLISILYGFVCIVFAFMADGLGGVLQTSLTILGVVGGPTLGLFSLGMFFPHANEVGAVSGFILSLVLTFWLGFSGKPAPIKLSTTSDGCFANDSANFTSSLFECNLRINSIKSETEHIYLFRLSYLWLSVLGLLACLLVGILVSCFLNSLNKSFHKEVNSEMFAPPISFYLKRQYNVHQVNERQKGQESQLQMKEVLNNDNEEQSLCLKT